jgi:hypothetical protein
MPNITITVDDRLYRAARIYAAQYETTLTEIMREFLTEIIPSNCYLGDMNYETFTGLERDRRRNAAREPRLERGYPLPPSLSLGQCGKLYVGKHQLAPDTV